MCAVGSFFLNPNASLSIKFGVQLLVVVYTSSFSAMM